MTEMARTDASPGNTDHILTCLWKQKAPLFVEELVGGRGLMGGLSWAPSFFMGYFFLLFWETPEYCPPLLPVAPNLCSRVTLSRKTAVHVDWG